MSELNNKFNNLIGNNRGSIDRIISDINSFAYGDDEKLKPLYISSFKELYKKMKTIIDQFDICFQDPDFKRTLVNDKGYLNIVEDIRTMMVEKVKDETALKEYQDENPGNAEKEKEFNEKEKEITDNYADEIKRLKRKMDKLNKILH